MEQKTELYNFGNGRANIATYSSSRTGKLVNVLEMTTDDIIIEDIAHSLSNQCRFGGHTKEFYSVAQHSVHCAELLSEFDRNMRLAALLHDASEAYLIDVPKPVKTHLVNYKEIEDKIQRIIAEKFGLSYPFLPAVHAADERALEIEWKHLIQCVDVGLRPKPPEVAKRRFLEVFTELTS